MASEKILESRADPYLTLLSRFWVKIRALVRPNLQGRTGFDNDNKDNDNEDNKDNDNNNKDKDNEDEDDDNKDDDNEDNNNKDNDNEDNDNDDNNNDSDNDNEDNEENDNEDNHATFPTNKIMNSHSFLVQFIFGNHFFSPDLLTSLPTLSD